VDNVLPSVRFSICIADNPVYALLFYVRSKANDWKRVAVFLRILVRHSISDTQPETVLIYLTNTTFGSHGQCEDLGPYSLAEI